MEPFCWSCKRFDGCFQHQTFGVTGMLGKAESWTNKQAAGGHPKIKLLRSIHLHLFLLLSFMGVYLSLVYFNLFHFICISQLIVSVSPSSYLFLSSQQNMLYSLGCRWVVSTNIMLIRKPNITCCITNIISTLVRENVIQEHKQI